MAGFGLYGATRLAVLLDAAECPQSGEIMVFGQTLGGNHRADPGLLATMPGSLLTRGRMVWQQLAETGPGAGWQLAWLAFSARQ